MNSKKMFPFFVVQILLLYSVSSEVTDFSEDFFNFIENAEDMEFQLPEGAIEKIGNNAAQHILHNILLPILRAEGKKSQLHNDIRIPLLPPLEDEITLPIPEEGLNIPVNIEQLIIGSTELNVTGDFNITTGTISGISSLQDDLEIGLPVLTVYYKLWFEEFQNLIGHNTFLDIYNNLPIPPLQHINIMGTGDLGVNVTGGSFNVTLTIDVQDKLNVTDFYAGLDIEALHLAPVNLSDFRVFASGTEIFLTEETWAGISSLLTGAAKGLLAELRDEINAAIQAILNALIQECTIGDIIGGDFTCLPFIPDPVPTSTEIPTTDMNSTTEMDSTTSCGVRFFQIEYAIILACLTLFNF